MLPRCWIVLLLGVCGWASAEEAPQSPRLAKLASAVESAEGAAAEAAFWQEVSARGTPLVEPVTGNPRRVLMTFLWHAEDDRAELNVGVMGVNKRSFETRVDGLTHLKKSAVWYRTYEVDSVARFEYFLTWPEGQKPRPDVLERYPTEQGPVYELLVDPLSTHKARYEIGDGQGSYAQGPDAPTEPWADERHGVPKGSTSTFRSHSQLLNNERDITVYTPPGYSGKGARLPLVLVFDRTEYLQTLNVPQLLDNMIADEVVPPMVAILVGNVVRHVELPPNPTFAKYLAEELIPQVQARYRISTQGARNVVAGASYGGIASTFAAHSYPQLFGNVLSQSGSYWWHPDYELEDADAMSTGWNWLPRLFSTGKHLPIRFYIDVGTWEGAGMLSPNRSFRDLLRAGGYDVQYREFVGSHTYLSWRATFPDGLIALVGTPRGKAWLHDAHRLAE